MKIGQAFYCDGCGVNLYSGSHCNECEPATGSEQVTHTFLVTGTMVPGGSPSNEPGLQILDEQVRISLGDFVQMAEPSRQEEHKPWWKLF